ncbi:hypothetical protein ACF1AX_20085 [Streptomyces sp. NPDC014802]|uniref:hypothetical protein n=1 Tax=Streptomyces sp. NPDC014802 TaxID=3364917 RepID=UPI0036F6CCAE
MLMQITTESDHFLLDFLRVLIEQRFRTVKGSGIQGLGAERADRGQLNALGSRLHCARVEQDRILQKPPARRVQARNSPLSTETA